MVDISALLGDQPLIDEGGEGSDESLDPSSEGGGEGSDYLGSEPPAVKEGDEPPPQRNQKVPLAALHEERTKRQALETQVQQQTQQQAQTMERLTKLLEAQQQAAQPKSEPVVVPNFVDDPEAAFHHVQQQLEDTRRQMQDYLNGSQQQSQAQQQHVQLAQQVSQQETQFTQTVPDYPHAADYFYNRKVAEYAAFTGDEFAAKQQVAKDYAGIAQLAQRLGKNPAELMYNAAKAMGYTPGAKPGTPPARKEPPTSLANVHGSPRAPDEQGNVTAADIAGMSDKEFDAFFASMSRGGAVRPKV